MPDDELFTELTMMPFKSKEHIGVNLISRKEICIECGGIYFYEEIDPVK